LELRFVPFLALPMLRHAMADHRHHYKLQEPEAAAAIVSANIPTMRTDVVKPESAVASAIQAQQSQSRPSSSMKRTFSAEGGVPPKFDKLGRRILISSSGSRPGSATSSIPGTPRRVDSDVRVIPMLGFFCED